MKQIFTYTVLALFLVLRYSSGYLFTNTLEVNAFVLAKAVLIFIICVLILMTIWVNKASLYEFNIDKTFFLIILADFLLLIWGYFPIGLGASMLVVVGILLYDYRKQTYNLSRSTLLSPQIFGLMISIIILPVFFSTNKNGVNITDKQIVDSLVNANLFGVIFEEFLFRGLLWGFFRNRGIAESKIALFQAVLFWLAHYRSLLNGNMSFWTSIPFASIILGILVLRSKSLTFSTVSHFLYNLFVGIFA